MKDFKTFEIRHKPSSPRAKTKSRHQPIPTNTKGGPIKSKLRQLTASEFEDQFRRNKGLMLICYCHPAKGASISLLRKFESILKQFQGKIEFLYVNIDGFPKLTRVLDGEHQCFALLYHKEQMVHGFNKLVGTATLARELQRKVQVFSPQPSVASQTSWSSPPKSGASAAPSIHKKQRPIPPRQSPASKWKTALQANFGGSNPSAIPPKHIKWLLIGLGALPLYFLATMHYGLIGLILTLLAACGLAYLIPQSPRNRSWALRRYSIIAWVAFFFMRGYFLSFEDGLIDPATGRRMDSNFIIAFFWGIGSVLGSPFTLLRWIIGPFFF